MLTQLYSWLDRLIWNIAVNLLKPSNADCLPQAPSTNITFDEPAHTLNIEFDFRELARLNIWHHGSEHLGRHVCRF